MTIADVVTTLTILREQLATKGHSQDEFDELIMTADEVRLKRGTRTLKIPLVSQSCVGGAK